MVLNDAYESLLSELCECMHQGLEEGGVVGPRGCVRGRVLGSSSGALQFDTGSGGGEGLDETAVCLLEGGAGVADGDGHELHLSPELLEFIDEGGVFGGLLLEPLVASEVLAETDLDNDHVALLAVEGGRVRLGAVRDSSGVDQVGGCSLSRAKEAFL